MRSLMFRGSNCFPIWPYLKCEAAILGPRSPAPPPSSSEDRTHIKVNAVLMDEANYYDEIAGKYPILGWSWPLSPATTNFGRMRALRRFCSQAQLGRRVCPLRRLPCDYAGLFVSAALAKRNFAPLNPPHARKYGLARVLLRRPASITKAQFNTSRASATLYRGGKFVYGCKTHFRVGYRHI